MATTFRSATSVAPASRTNTTGTAPAGNAAGDEYVAIHAVGAVGAVPPVVTGPASWVKEAETIYGLTADNFFVRLTLWTIPRGTAAFTWTHAAGTSSLWIGAYIGVDQTTPMDVTPSTAAATGSVVPPAGLTATAPSITTVTNGAMLIIGRGSWDGNAITPPASWTERLDNALVWTGDLLQTTAGATGAVAVPSGNAGGSSPCGVILAALRPAGSGSSIVKTPAEILGLADVLTRSVGRAQAPTDNLGITDALMRSVGLARTDTDDLGLTDTLSRSLGVGRAAADQLGLVDDATVLVGRGQAPADELGLTDALAAVHGLGRALNDPLNLTDAVTLMLGRAISAGDTEDLSDEVIVVVGRNQQPADDLGLSDTLTIARTVHLVFGDGLGLVDNALPIIAGSGVQNVADVLALSDAIVIARTINLVVADQLGLTDTLVRSRGISLSAADQLGLTDTVVQARALIQVVADQVELTDHATSGSGGDTRLYVGDQPVAAVRYGVFVVDAIYVGDTQVWP